MAVTDIRRYEWTVGDEYYKIKDRPPFRRHPDTDWDKLFGAIEQTSTKVKDKDKEEVEEMADNVLRLVRVLVVDPDCDVPSHSRLVYDSDEFVTDATDDELRMTIPNLSQLIETHNTMRTKLLDSEYPDKTVYLPAAQLRDLIVKVHTVVRF